MLLFRLKHWSISFLICVAVSPSPGEELLRVQYDPWDQVITIPVKVFDQSHWFLVDTGCSFTLLDSSFTTHLGRVLGRTAGEPKMDIYACPRLEIGNFVLQGEDAIACTDLKQFSLRTKQLSGIIGMDLLDNFIVRVDPDHTTFSLITPSDDPESNWGTKFGITINERNVPTIACHVDGTTSLSFLIDLGNADTLDLSAEATRHLLASNPEALTSVSIASRQSIKGRRNELISRLNSFSLGQYVHSNLVCARSDINCIGVHYLRRYTATFDFPRRNLYLKPSKYFAEYDYSHDGLIVGAGLVEGKGYRLGVYEGSTADSAGLFTDDVLLEIDGQKVSEMDVEKLTRYLQLTTSHDISLVVQRGDEALRFTLPRGGKSGRIITRLPTPDDPLPATKQ